MQHLHGHTCHGIWEWELIHSKWRLCIYWVYIHVCAWVVAVHKFPHIDVIIIIIHYLSMYPRIMKHITGLSWMLELYILACTWSHNYDHDPHVYPCMALDPWLFKSESSWMLCTIEMPMYIQRAQRNQLKMTDEDDVAKRRSLEANFFYIPLNSIYVILITVAIQHLWSSYNPI